MKRFKEKYLCWTFFNLFFVLLPPGESFEDVTFKGTKTADGEKTGTESNDSSNQLFLKIKDHIEQMRKLDLEEGMREGKRQQTVPRTVPNHQTSLESSDWNNNIPSSLDQRSDSDFSNYAKLSKAVDSVSRTDLGSLVADGSLNKFYESLANLDNHQADIGHDTGYFLDTADIADYSNIQITTRPNLTDASSSPSDYTNSSDSSGVHSKFPPVPLEDMPGVSEWIKSSLYHLSQPKNPSQPTAYNSKDPLGFSRFLQTDLPKHSDSDVINILITENKSDSAKHKPNVFMLNTSNSSLNEISELQHTVSSAVSAALNNNEQFEEALAQVMEVPGEPPTISVVNSTIPNLAELKETLQKILGSNVIYKKNVTANTANGIITAKQNVSVINNLLNRTVGVGNLDWNSKAGKINIVNIFIINILQNPNVPYDSNNPASQNGVSSTKVYSQNNPLKSNSPDHLSLTDSSDGSLINDIFPVNYKDLSSHDGIAPSIPVLPSVDPSYWHYPANIEIFDSDDDYLVQESVPIQSDKIVLAGNHDSSVLETFNETLSYNNYEYEEILDASYSLPIANQNSAPIKDSMHQNLATLHSIISKLQSSTSSLDSFHQNTEINKIKPNLSNPHGLNLNENTVLDLLPSFVRATTIAPIIPLNNASMYRDVVNKPSVLGLLPNQLFAISHPKLHLKNNSATGGIIRKDLMESQASSIGKDNFSSRYAIPFADTKVRRAGTPNLPLGANIDYNINNFESEDHLSDKVNPLSRLSIPPNNIKNNNDHPDYSGLFKDIHPMNLIELLNAISKSQIEKNMLRQNINDNVKEVDKVTLTSAEGIRQSLMSSLSGLNIDSLKKALTIGAIPGGLAFASALFPYWSPLVFGKKRRKRDAKLIKEDQQIRNYFPMYYNDESNPNIANDDISDLNKDEFIRKEGLGLDEDFHNSSFPNGKKSRDGKVSSANNIGLDRKILTTFVDSMLAILQRDSSSNNALPREKFNDDYSKLDYVINQEVTNELPSIDSSHNSKNILPYNSLISATGNQIHLKD